MSVTENTTKCICGGKEFKIVFSYGAPPKEETRFEYLKEKPYHREIFRCLLCGHFLSIHHMTSPSLYEGEYVNSVYKDEEGIKKAYNKINGLPESSSDNVGRVKNLLHFAENFFSPSRFSNRKPTILDIGSGLCVFLYRMKNAGWDCTALDPDHRAIEHAKKQVQVRGVCASFEHAKDLEKHDVVSFNKVLEHVANPVEMLSRASEFLEEGGFIYIEVPDGEMASCEGSDRQEFAIDHYHIFSAASAAILVEQAGFRLISSSRLKEPSGKFTLRVFCTRYKPEANR